MGNMFTEIDALERLTLLSKMVFPDGPADTERAWLRADGPELLALF